MNIGYARVSTEEQNLDLQIGALEAAGCDTIYEDRGISGAAAYRPGLADGFAARRARGPSATPDRRAGCHGR